jgi:hypothetical protein
MNLLSRFQTQTGAKEVCGPLRPDAPPLVPVCISNQDKWADPIYMAAPSPFPLVYFLVGGVWICASFFLFVCTSGVY